MLGLVLIVLLALVLLGYVAVPLLAKGQSDPLPDYRDPVAQELEEEKVALFRAIRELEAREDLAAARRDELRARYEAKAAKVLRELDERRAELAGARPAASARSPRRLPVTALALLGIMGATAVVMSGFVLPRVGMNATVTTGDLEAGRALRELQRAAERDPSQANLLALADAYWQQGITDMGGAPMNEVAMQAMSDALAQAGELYRRVAQDTAPAPALVYQRLGMLALQNDFEQAQGYFEQALELEPDNLDTLYTLAEVYFAQAQPERAVATLERYLAQPEAASDTQARARLETMRALEPVLRRATDDPSEDNLLALADAYWQQNEQQRAADIYLRVLQNLDPHSVVALSRLGQLLFVSGRTPEAIDLLERARGVEANDPDTLLFLGNAYFSQARFEDAIATWEAYVAAVGGEAQAGRVPGLIAGARARLTGAESASAPAAQGEQLQVALSGEQLFAANCAVCHGVAGQGGNGPRLVGNARARNEANVRDAVQFGRGMMPGFGAQLSEAELEAVSRYVLEVLGPDSEASTRP